MYINVPNVVSIFTVHHGQALFCTVHGADQNLIGVEMKWMPCSERKPKHKQLVIIKMGNNESSFNNTRTAQYNSADKVFIYNISKKSSGCIKEEFVTEWFPFPEVDDGKN